MEMANWVIWGRSDEIVILNLTKRLFFYVVEFGLLEEIVLVVNQAFSRRKAIAEVLKSFVDRKVIYASLRVDKYRRHAFWA